MNFSFAKLLKEFTCIDFKAEDMQNSYWVEWQSSLKQSVDSLYNKIPKASSNDLIENDNLEVISANLKIARSIVNDLSKLIEEYDFKQESEETVFFKHIKPLFSGTLLYWERRLQFYLHRPIGGDNAIKKYYKRELKSLKFFYKFNAGFYEYLRGNYDYLDNLYFLRTSGKFEDAGNSVDLNSKFTTAKDRLVGEIYANNLLERHIQKLLILPREISSITEKEFPNLKWTGSRAGLVELIYALQSGGVYNNGQTSIKELADTFGKLFKVDLGNYYHVFNEIRLRKKNRTSLLDHLKEQVIRKMDTMDEK